MNQWMTAISDFKNRTVLRAKILFAKDEKERKDLLVAMGLTYKEGRKLLAEAMVEPIRKELQNKDCFGYTRRILPPEMQKGSVLIISVGTDERPAGPLDIECFTKAWMAGNGNSDLTCVTHHAVSFQVLNTPQNGFMNIIQLGSEDRPVGDEDIAQFQSQLAEVSVARAGNRFIITPLQVKTLIVPKINGPLPS